MALDQIARFAVRDRFPYDRRLEQTVAEFHSAEFPREDPFWVASQLRATKLELDRSKKRRSQPSPGWAGGTVGEPQV